VLLGVESHRGLLLEGWFATTQHTIPHAEVEASMSINSMESTRPAAAERR
jgi:hypothetical protein